MLNIPAISRLGLALPLILNCPFMARADEVDAPEQDVEAMEAIIVDFCATKNLCHGNQHGNFIVMLYDESEGEVLLSDTDKNTLAACQKKYEIRMTKHNVDTLFVYCYDKKQPKLLLERTMTRSIDLR